MAGASTVTARRAPIGIFRSGARVLVEAFLDPGARLLVAETAADKPVVRVAHEALLSEWERARSALADNAHLLSIRRATEERYLRSRDLSPTRPRRLV